MSGINRRAVVLASAVLMALMSFWAVPASAAEPVTVTATADSYVSASSRTSNFGGRLYFTVDNDPRQVAYLKFVIPDGTDLTDGVKLRVFAESSHRSGVIANAVSNTSWTETGITYDNAPAIGDEAGTSGALTASTWVEFDVTSAVTATGPVSLALQDTSTTAAKMTSREGANKPQLVIGGTTEPPTGTGTFTISPVQGGYQAVSGSIVYTGRLKAVGESAVADLKAIGGGTVEFTAGTFDFGTEYFKLEDVHDIDFVGAGMDQTVIRNASDAAADTEPFNFSGAFGIKIRNMTIAAGGAVRTTSDAVDFDEGNDSLVENVKISASRGAGIIFDGKNADWTADRNTVRNCVINGISGTGIDFLGSSSNTVTGCTITNTGGHGINIRISSPTADQANKKSNDNTITGNTIDQAGQHGIYVNTADRSKILDNTITNSSDDVTSRDGIRIFSSVTGLGCDDNTVSGTTATDNQATKTQTYGLNIASAACSRTVVGPGNNFEGNRVGPIRDLGTGTVYR